MGTTKRVLLGALAIGLLGTGSVAIAGPSATSASQALVGSDRPAGIVVFPKVIADISRGQDTVIEIANTSSDPVSLHCFYTEVARCAVTGDACRSDLDCFPGEGCVPVLDGGSGPVLWNTQDFSITLTPWQPLAWRVSEGLPLGLPCDPDRPFGDPNDPAQCAGGQVNNGLIAAREPFLGELKCVEVSDPDTSTPIADNSIIGKATIFGVGGIAAPNSTAASYNAIGIQAIENVCLSGSQVGQSCDPNANTCADAADCGTPNNGDDTLCLGTNATGCDVAEYASCPSTLILDHFFEGAIVEGSQVRTQLTLVPCTEIETAPTQTRTNVQILVFNEFEQRLSTNTSVECFTDTPLSDIDTRRSFPTDDMVSVFSVGVQGTLSGQTRLRPVSSNPDVGGNGILGVALQYHFGAGLGVAAKNLHFVGAQRTGDVVSLAIQTAPPVGP